MIHGHGGNVTALAGRLGCPAADIVDMSSNVNPLGSPARLMDHLVGALERIRQLPEADAGSTVSRMARYLGCTPASVVAGNGTTDLIYRLPRALTPRRVLIVGPTYADYADACRQNGISPRFLMAGPETDFHVDIDRLDRAVGQADLVVICNPNNPTGVLTDPDAIDALCARHPETCFVVDESYMPFAAPGASQRRRERPNLIVLQSLSKIFTLPGLRIWFAAAHPDIIARLRRYDSPWSMNALATAAVDFLMDNPGLTDAFIKESAAFLISERRRFIDRLATADGIRAFPSQTSFILLQFGGARRGTTFCEALGRRRILIRDCANFHGLSDRYIRVSLKSEAENRRCIDLLEAELANT